MKLKQYLRQNGVSEAEFAERIGVSVHGVHKWVHEQRIPRPGMVLKIEAETEGSVTFHDFAFGAELPEAAA